LEAGQNQLTAFATRSIKSKPVADRKRGFGDSVDFELITPIHDNFKLESRDEGFAAAMNRQGQQ